MSLEFVEGGGREKQETGKIQLDLFKQVKSLKRLREKRDFLRSELEKVEEQISYTASLVRGLTNKLSDQDAPSKRKNGKE